MSLSSTHYIIQLGAISCPKCKNDLIHLIPNVSEKLKISKRVPQLNFHLINSFSTKQHESNKKLKLKFIQTNQAIKKNSQFNAQ